MPSFLVRRECLTNEPLPQPYIFILPQVHDRAKYFIKLPDKLFKVRDGNNEIEYACSPGETHSAVVSRIARRACSDAWTLTDGAKTVVASSSGEKEGSVSYRNLRPGSVFTLSRGITITVTGYEERGAFDIALPPSRVVNVLELISTEINAPKTLKFALRDVVTFDVIPPFLDYLEDGRTYTLTVEH